MTLQEQGEQLLERLDLVAKLSQFGEAHVVGNIAFETTTKPDIDIQIYCDLHYEDAAKTIIETLGNLGFSDFKERRLKKSKKYLILANFTDNDVVWTLDLTLTQPDISYLKDSYKFYTDYYPKINETKRDIIIKLKQAFSNTKLMGDNTAFYIYKGVLDENISTAEEMTQYFEKTRSKK